MQTALRSRPVRGLRSIGTGLRQSKEYVACRNALERSDNRCAARDFIRAHDPEDFLVLTERGRTLRLEKLASVDVSGVSPQLRDRIDGWKSRAHLSLFDAWKLRDTARHSLPASAS